MKDYQKLLLSNKAWARGKVQENPDFFSKLVSVQNPKYLWIGCADSRVPPNEITQTDPGEIFIHRNVANLVIHTDLNMLSALQYAVEVLEVEHIIVCGHYGCGGVKAAMGKQSLGLINKWLRHIKDVYRFNYTKLDAIQDEKERLNELIRLNVKEQIMNLAKTSIVQKAWKTRNAPQLHGWVYDLHDGIIDPICELFPNSSLDLPLYEYDNLEE